MRFHKLTAARKASLAILMPALLSVMCTAVAQNEQITVDPGHPANSFSPLQALGGAVDRQRGGTTREAIEKHTTWVLTDPGLEDLLGAGWGAVSYRQNTELQIEAWHWNPSGTWSNAANKEGYFAGSAEPTSEQIVHSW